LKVIGIAEDLFHGYEDWQERYYKAIKGENK